VGRVPPASRAARPLSPRWLGRWADRRHGSARPGGIWLFPRGDVIGETVSDARIPV